MRTLLKMARNHGRLHLLDLNEECQTPLQLARALGQPECLAVLEEALDGLMQKHGNSEAAVVSGMPIIGLQWLSDGACALQKRRLMKNKAMRWQRTTRLEEHLLNPPF